MLDANSFTPLTEHIITVLLPQGDTSTDRTNGCLDQISTIAEYSSPVPAFCLPSFVVGYTIITEYIDNDPEK